MINADFNPITDNGLRGLGRAEHRGAGIGGAGQAPFPAPPPEDTEIQQEQTSAREGSLNFSEFKTSPCSTQLSAAGKSQSVPKTTSAFSIPENQLSPKTSGSYARSETMETRAWSLLL